MVRHFRHTSSLMMLKQHVHTTHALYVTALWKIILFSCFPGMHNGKKYLHCFLFLPQLMRANTHSAAESQQYFSANLKEIIKIVLIFVLINFVIMIIIIFIILVVIRHKMPHPFRIALVYYKEEIMLMQKQKE